MHPWALVLSYLLTLQGKIKICCIIPYHFHLEVTLLHLQTLCRNKWCTCSPFFRVQVFFSLIRRFSDIYCVFYLLQNLENTSSSPMFPPLSTQFEVINHLSSWIFFFLYNWSYHPCRPNSATKVKFSYSILFCIWSFCFYATAGL